MSIADKLTYLGGTKNLLREAINAAGGNLTQETPFREYAGGWLRDQSASLSLDFSKQQYVAKDKVSMFPDRVGFEDIVTFARSTGGGRFNAQGEYEWVGPDEPRIDYDPVTGECLGLLIEEQRTNIIQWSEDFTNPVWSTSVATVEPAGIVTPITGSGGYLLSLEDSAAVSVLHFIRQGAIKAPVGTYTHSYIVRQVDNHPYVAIRGVRAAMLVKYNLNSSKVVDYNGAAVTPKITPIGSGFFLLTCSETTTVANGFPGIYPCTVGASSEVFVSTGSEKVIVVCGQVEAGSSPTSYIPTTTAQVTRAADIAIVNELSPWYNPNQGSFSIKAKGHIGEPLLTAGDASIIADSDELKEYQVSYYEDQQATQVDMGKGLIESIRYWPRETA